MKDYLKVISPFLLDYEDEVRKVRRDLHQIPELGLEEFKTQEYIKNYLTRLGYNPEEIIGTGLTLFIPGETEETIALRTDIDALPIMEPEGNEYRSKHKGIMHACGHDGHMTMLLLLAKILKDHPEIKHPNLLLIFQPAEEGPGGAEKIVRTGLLDRYHVKAIYGFHLIPYIKEGTVSTNPGPMFAQTSEFYPVISGKKSHAGNPEDGIDTIVAASQFVLSVQHLISRNMKPSDAALINIGTFNAGDAMNIVAGEAKLTGTIRSYSKEDHKRLKQRLKEVLAGIDLAFGTKSSLNFVDMYNPLINDNNLFNRVWNNLEPPKEIFEKVMMAEDFSMYLDNIPGLFIGLGTMTDQFNSGLHTAEFNFNEEVLLRGIDTYLKIIETYV